MANRDIIVVGTSAGGVEALTGFVRSIPNELKASIFIVLHLPALAKSNLPPILSRAGTWPAVHATNGEKIEKRKIYIAPPDHHLILGKGGRITVSKGPRENRFRPSIDALFRSAALVYGPRAVGIILSGMLDDGTSGMWNIKQAGGLAIVQDPDEALFPSMIQNVQQYVNVDHVSPSGELGGLLAKITRETAPKQPERTKEEMERLKMEVVIATHDNAFEVGILKIGELTTFCCPECKGALVSIGEGEMIRFRCHTGHAYTTSTLWAGVTVEIEEKLREATQGLQATNKLLLQISACYNKSGKKEAAKLFKQKANDIAKRTRIIQDAVFMQELMSKDMLFETKPPERSVNIRSRK